jgi:2Fe-2S ferredoxin
MIVNAIDRNGVLHVLEGDRGSSVMQVVRDALDNGIGVCGGACTCATCHIYVDQVWAAKLQSPSGDEPDMLQVLEIPSAGGSVVSRLGCQIVLTPELEGLTFTLAPEP